MDQASTTTGPGAAAAVRTTLKALALCLILGLLAPVSITRYYLFSQDLPALALAMLIALVAWRAPWPQVGEIRLSGRGAALAALAAGVAAYAGHYWLLQNYALTRDEQMALFDAQILAHGRLVWPLPIAWQHHAAMLNTMFMPQVAEPLAWVSGYLPGNALLRAAIGTLADPALTGPLMTTAAVGLTWLCARRLWPGEREAQAIATLLVALSGQVLFTGMTAYAMPAHLALNLLWLWLYLRGRIASDIAAVAVGFVATGLHQPIFHPLFVAPWLALLLWQREWRRLACYALPYAAIGVFWLAWPHWQAAAMIGPHSTIAATEMGLAAKLWALIGQNGGGLAVMGANLVRFAAWQPIALIPLCVLGWLAARRDPRAAALAGGIVLTLFTAVLLMAYQGHGFGYRYFHGLIGNAALLAGFGWRSLDRSLPRARTTLLASLALGALAVLPVQGWFAHRFYAAYAGVDRKISASPAQFMVIGAQDAPFTADLVFNRPDLSNRPIRIVADMARSDAELAAQLCRDHALVALPAAALYRPIDDLFGNSPSDEADRRAARLAPVLAAAGCRVTSLD